MIDSKNESELIKKAQSGDSAAMADIWESVTPKLFGYLVNTLKDKALAEDIVQNTWLKAIKALPQFRGQGYGISAWLFAIARNECNQHWRKNKDTVDIEDIIDEPGVDSRKDIDNKLIVEKILNKLNSEEQELLRLRYIADLPVSDIARILNINFVAARVRLHRAIKKAQDNLKFKI